MTDLTKLKEANTTRWHSAKIRPVFVQVAEHVAHSLVQAKTRYQIVQDKTNVPWPVIAVIHERESSQSWAASLAQGDPWDHVSIHIPKGRGPFHSWEEAAMDALKVCPPHAADWHDWSIGGALTLLEQYNGLGYFHMERPSPYVWSGTDQYNRGKYIADGHYDQHAVDKQLGCATMLMVMKQIDPSIEGEFT